MTIEELTNALRGETCDLCHGEGVIEHWHKKHKELKEKTCERCDGSGLFKSYEVEQLLAALRDEL